MTYPQFTRDLKDRYLQMLMTNAVGNTYIVTQDESGDTVMDIHRAMLAEDPVYMAQAAIFARENGYTRLQPIISLAFLSTAEDKGPFQAAFKRVILTPNNLFDFVKIVSGIRQGKGFGRTIKRAIGKWYNSLSEYHVMKYGADTKTNATGVKEFDLKDILKLVRPIPATGKQKELFKYILDKEDVEYTRLPQLLAYEHLKKETDMDRVRTLIADARIPHEVATGAVHQPDLATWTQIMKQMPIFALVRNLNTLQKHGVLNSVDNRAHVIGILTNEQAVTRSKMLPYRFLTAYQQYAGHEDIRQALRIAIDLSFVNVPDILGRTHVSIDKSGSMAGDRITQACIFGVASYLKAPDSELTLFDTDLYHPNVSRHLGLMDNIQKVPHASGGTAVGLPLQHLLGTVGKGGNAINSFMRITTGYNGSFPLNKRNHKPVYVDNIVIITDEEQNTGTPLVTEFHKYRATVNPNAKLFIINVAGTTHHAMPQNDEGVFYVFGWSDQVLQYVSYITHGFAGQRAHVESISLDELVAIR